jgi:hypothetical protein
MPAKKLVSVASLGLCEYCGTLLTMEGMPADSIGAEWKCSECEGVLTHKSFGYDKGSEGAKKIAWVGPEGTWVPERPAQDFDLESFSVIVQPLRYPLY